jgi:diadenylate cyclase
VVVSETSIVRVFDDGEIVAEIIPELWLLRRHGLHLKGAYSARVGEGMAVTSKTEGARERAGEGADDQQK